jgi:hypothetical protein
MTAEKRLNGLESVLALIERRLKEDLSLSFATMMQTFKADEYRGRRLQLTGFAKTEDVKNWCGLWMRIDGRGGEMLGFDNMGRRPIVGSRPRNQYRIVLECPRMLSRSRSGCC